MATSLMPATINVPNPVGLDSIDRIDNLSESFDRLRSARRCHVSCARPSFTGLVNLKAEVESAL
jgi:hypothetical protein